MVSQPAAKPSSMTGNIPMTTWNHLPFSMQVTIHYGFHLIIHPQFVNVVTQYRLLLPQLNEMVFRYVFLGFSQRLAYGQVKTVAKPVFGSSD
jgi:hypothetical protein